MSVLDENPNCHHTHATFRLVGDDLSTQEITSRLRIEPTFAADKGRERPLRGGKSVTQPTGVWSISSEGRLDTTSLERHLLWLLDILDPVRDELLRITRSFKARPDFFC